MKPEEINVAIAEAVGTVREELGIKYPDGCFSFGNSEEYTRQKCANYQSRGMACELVTRKVSDEDYYEDLNAIHGAVQKLNINQLSDYLDHLDKVCVPVHICPTTHSLAVIEATAPQRCEALLKTLGKWVETKGED